MRRVVSLEKTLMLGGIRGRRRRGRQRMKWLDGITDSTLMVLWGFPWGLPWGLGLFLVSGELMQEANRHMSSSPGAGGSRYLSRPSPTGGSEARMCGWAWGSLTSMCTACP